MFVVGLVIGPVIGLLVGTMAPARWLQGVSTAVAVTLALLALLLFGAVPLALRVALVFGIPLGLLLALTPSETAEQTG